MKKQETYETWLHKVITEEEYLFIPSTPGYKQLTEYLFITGLKPKEARERIKEVQRREKAIKENPE